MMAVKKTTSNIVVNLLLDNGETSSGTAKTIPQSIGTIDKNRYEAAKAKAIADLLNPCLSKSIYAVSESVSSYLESE